MFFFLIIWPLAQKASSLLLYDFLHPRSGKLHCSSITQVTTNFRSNSRAVAARRPQRKLYVSALPRQWLVKLYWRKHFSCLKLTLTTIKKAVRCRKPFETFVVDAARFPISSRTPFVITSTAQKQKLTKNMNEYYVSQTPHKLTIAIINLFLIILLLSLRQVLST